MGDKYYFITEYLYIQSARNAGSVRSRKLSAMRNYFKNYEDAKDFQEMILMLCELKEYYPIRKLRNDLEKYIRMKLAEEEVIENLND